MIPVLLVIVVILLVYRGGLRESRPLWTPGRPIGRDDPLRLLLFAILILLLIGILVRLLMPLGNY